MSHVLPPKILTNEATETVKMLNQNGMLDCSCLASTQEEADTRIILHALYSDKRIRFKVALL